MEQTIGTILGHLFTPAIFPYFGWIVALVAPFLLLGMAVFVFKKFMQELVKTIDRNTEALIQASGKDDQIIRLIEIQMHR